VLVSRYTLRIQDLYDATNAKRRAQDLSWRALGRELCVSASSLTQMKHGRKPSADGLTTLLVWLQQPAALYAVDTQRDCT